MTQPEPGPPPRVEPTPARRPAAGRSIYLIACAFFGLLGCMVAAVLFLIMLRVASGT